MRTRAFSAVGAVTVAALIALANPAAAHGGYGGGRGGAKLFSSSFQTAYMARRLDLTDEQRAQMREILDAARPEADRLADEMIGNRRAMKAFKESETFSEDEIRVIAERQGGLVADMMVLHARVHSQIKTIMTPDQYDRFKRLHRRHHGKRHRGGDVHEEPKS